MPVFDQARELQETYKKCNYKRLSQSLHVSSATAWEPQETVGVNNSPKWPQSLHAPFVTAGWEPQETLIVHDSPKWPESLHEPFVTSRGPQETHDANDLQRRPQSLHIPFVTVSVL